MNPVFAVMAVTAAIVAVVAPIEFWYVKLIALWCGWQYFTMGINDR